MARWKRIDQKNAIKARIEVQMATNSDDAKSKLGHLKAFIYLSVG